MPRNRFIPPPIPIRWVPAIELRKILFGARLPCSPQPRRKARSPRILEDTVIPLATSSPHSPSHHITLPRHIFTRRLLRAVRSSHSEIHMPHLSRQSTPKRGCLLLKNGALALRLISLKVVAHVQPDSHVQPDWSLMCCRTALHANLQRKMMATTSLLEAEHSR